MRNLIVCIDELWLKGKNQPYYIKVLKKQVLRKIKKYHDGIHYLYRNERMMIECQEDLHPNVIESLRKIPGISVIQPATRVDFDESKLAEVALSMVEDQVKEGMSFGVRVRRTNKKYPTPSMELAKNIGNTIGERYPFLKVDLNKPDLKVSIKILADGFYIFIKEYRGVGGLPVGTSGHFITLLSGGFDSPVASYLMAKRGCAQTFMFFYAYPFVGDEVLEKIESLMKVLAAYHDKTKLYVIPFGPMQKSISDQCKPAYRTLLFRWNMVKTAALLAKQMNAQGIITGDALGQVSSQTIHNMQAINQATYLPLVRPLIGMNKQEILSISRLINTHDISVKPYDDACSMFASKNPVIKPFGEYWDRMTQKVENTKELEELIEKAEIRFYS